MITYFAQQIFKSLDDIRDTFAKTPVNPTCHMLYPIGGEFKLLPRKEVKVLTYNLFLRPPLVKNNESDHKSERLREFVKTFHEYDIICLQEVFGFLSGRKDELINYAKKAGFLYSAVSPTPSMFSKYLTDGGLLVLSRFPIVKNEYNPYPYGVFADSLSQKGVLYTKVKIQDSYIHLFTTHTQASYIDSDATLPVLCRGDQFISARIFMDKCLRQEGYDAADVILVAGDFNVDSRNAYKNVHKLQRYPGIKDSRERSLNEYDAMVHILSNGRRDTIIDHVFERYEMHPVTYGDSELDLDTSRTVPGETVLTLDEDLLTHQCLDYIFEIIPASTLEKRKSLNLSNSQKYYLDVVDKSAFIERFRVEDKKFKQLSDHYAVGCALKYGKDVPLSPGAKSPMIANSEAGSETTL
jgi:endonuclease/exonuclease/phosphatase family metal-dependent hydrolase